MFGSLSNSFATTFGIERPSPLVPVVTERDKTDMLISSGTLPLQSRVKSPIKFPRSGTTMFDVGIQDTGDHGCGRRNERASKEQDDTSCKFGGNNHGNRASGVCCVWVFIRSCSASLPIVLKEEDCFDISVT